MAINPNIKKKANDIRNKIYGKEVRESLASGLEAMSTDVVENTGRQSVVEGRQDSVESQWQVVSDEMTDKDVISAPEIIAARDGEANLKARLDKENQEVTTQLAQIAINVKQFGAVGNGTTDDLHAINEAIDFAIETDIRKIYFPPGEYRLSYHFEIPSDFEVFGAGMFISTLVPDYFEDDSNPNVISASGTEDNRLRNIVIHDLGVDGRNRVDYIGQFGRINMRYVDHFVAYNVHGHMVGNLFDLYGCEYFEIDRVGIHDSYCIVHLRSNVAQNKYGIITNVIADKSGSVIDFGGGGEEIIVSNAYGEHKGYTANLEEALDIGGAKNIQINNSIFRGYASGAVVKGESGRTWDNIQFNNVDFYDFEYWGVTATPGSETESGEISFVNCRFETNRQIIDDDRFAIRGLNNLTKINIKNVVIKTNAGGVYASIFEHLNIVDLDIQAGERGIFVDSAGSNGGWKIDGLIVESDFRAIELTGTTDSQMLTNFHIKKSGSIGLSYRHVKAPYIANGIIENVAGHAISLQFGINTITTNGGLNSLDVTVKDVTIKNWGNAETSNRSGLIFVLPTVSGEFVNVRLFNIDFIIDDNSLLNNQNGLNLAAFSNGLNKSWLDNFTYYNLPIPQTGGENKRTDVKENYITI